MCAMGQMLSWPEAHEDIVFPDMAWGGAEASTLGSIVLKTTRTGQSQRFKPMLETSSEHVLSSADSGRLASANRHGQPSFPGTRVEAVEANTGLKVSMTPATTMHRLAMIPNLIQAM